MDIQTFVKSTLVQIAQGVREAQKEVSEAGGIANPSTHNGLHNREVSHIDFDLAVIVQSSTEAGGGAKLEIPTIFSMGGSAKGTDSSQQTSRIAFKVPFVYPFDEKSQAELLEGKRQADAAIRGARY